jgi:hypothetical protein
MSPPPHRTALNLRMKNGPNFTVFSVPNFSGGKNTAEPFLRKTSLTTFENALITKRH